MTNPTRDNLSQVRENMRGTTALLRAISTPTGPWTALTYVGLAFLLWKGYITVAVIGTMVLLILSFFTELLYRGVVDENFRVWYNVRLPFSYYVGSPFMWHVWLAVLLYQLL